jgi:hypothetical protein
MGGPAGGLDAAHGLDLGGAVLVMVGGRQKISGNADQRRAVPGRQNNRAAKKHGDGHPGEKQDFSFHRGALPFGKPKPLLAGEKNVIILFLL